MNRLFAKVFCDLGSGVVRAEGLLVDVFLEDVAQNFRVDFVVPAAGRVVEVPCVTVEEVEQILKGPIGNGYLRGSVARSGGVGTGRH